MTPVRRLRFLAPALFLVLVLVVGAANAPRLFRTAIYEHGDLAANSLAVREAKVFQRLTGQYSRWGFSHPGPGWFYAMAAGEAVFHDGLHVAPAPWNAQMLAVLLVNAGFLAAALGIVAREVAANHAANGGERPAAPGLTMAGVGLAVSAGLLGALGPNSGMLLNWMPYLMIASFAALLVAAASVGGAGRGDDLGTLALAGAALLHSHVAQPLFVFPLVGLAWAGLAWRHGGRPWRAFPGAHALAVAVALLAALPVALDAARGAGSNFSLILNHQRLHVGERHPWLDALAYNLRLAGLKPMTASGEQFYPGGATPAALAGYLGRNVPVFVLWTLVGVALAAGARRRGFGRGLLGSVALAAGLCVLWAARQDGQLLYFNSWFVYGGLLAAALGAAAAVVAALAARFPRAARSPWPAVAALAAGTALLGARAGRFSAGVGTDPASPRLSGLVGDALAGDDAGRGRLKYLAFPHPAWEDAASIALELDRRGERWLVPPGWEVVFGARHSPADAALVAALTGAGAPRVWHVAPHPADPAAPRPPGPFYHGGELRLDSPAVDPAGPEGATVAFAGPRPDAGAYVLTGWSAPAPGDPFTWTERPAGLMAFRAVAVPAGPGATVEITVDAFPALTPGRVDAQRLELDLDDRPVGRWTVREGDGPLRASVPADAWNARADALLRWRFPDAVSPASLGGSGDTREIAFGFRAVRFVLKPGS